MPNGTPPTSKALAEAATLICGLALFIGLLVFGVLFVQDLITNGFRGWARLTLGLAFICGPWIIGLLIAIYFVRREHRRANS